jgi:SAM-dependent methyltransferase
MGQPADYVIEMSEAELQRLLRLAAIGSDAVRSSCFLAGITAGSRVVDVGCGALGALKDLAEMVGPSGKVMGIDVSKEALARARQALDRTSLDWVELRRVDVNSDDATADICPPGPFDLAFCRLVLTHQSNPADTLRKIARLVRADGMIVVHEPWYGQLVSDLPPEYSEGLNMFLDAVAAGGGSPHVGSDMTRVALDAGLEIVRQFGQVPYSNGDGALAFTAATVRSTRTAIGRLPQYSEEHIDRVLAALDDAIRSAKYNRFMLRGLVMSVQMRVPG